MGKKKWFNRRNILKSAGIVGLGGLTGYTSRTGSRTQPDSITLGTWGGSFQEVMQECCVTPFEEETGVTVEYILAQNEERLSRLIAQQNNPPMDVDQQDGPGLIQGENSDLWHPLNEDLVPLYAEIPDSMKGDSWVFQYFAASSLLYSPDKVDEPDSWNVFTDPAHEGRVALFPREPMHDVMAFSLAQTDGESFKDLDQALTMYEEVVETMDPVFFSSSEELGKLWEQDEIDIGRYWSARAAQWNTEGKAVTSTIPSEGAMTRNYGDVIPRNIPEEKLEWAGRFINHTLQEHAAVSMAENLYYSSPNPNVDYPDEIEDKLVTSDDLESLLTPDFEWVAENAEDVRNEVQTIIQRHS